MKAVEFAIKYYAKTEEDQLVALKQQQNLLKQHLMIPPFVFNACFEAQRQTFFYHSSMVLKCLGSEKDPQSFFKFKQVSLTIFKEDANLLLEVLIGILKWKVVKNLKTEIKDVSNDLEKSIRLQMEKTSQIS